jgi:hypothetical protein
MHVVALEPYLEDLDESAYHKVMQSVHSTSVGDMEDLVTPLVPDGDQDYWREKFRDELLPKVKDVRYPWLNVAEEVQATKIGAYSIKLPYRERRENIESYFAANTAVPDEGTLREAVARVNQAFPKNLNLADLTEVYGKMPKGTNLGWPFFTSDKRYLPDVMRLAEDVRRKRFNVRLDPCLLFWRGQPRGIGLPSKNRSVWGYPHYLTMLELQIQMPLLSHLRGSVQFAAWNHPDVVDSAITYGMSLRQKQKISVDFSSYDQSLHPALIDGVEFVTKSSFRTEHHAQITYVFEAIRRIPLITPGGVVTGDHGMPSGSGLTNYGDGVAQWIGWEYVALMLGVQLLFLTFQGDDAVVVFSRPVDPGIVARIWKSDFGMSLSTEKSNVSNTEVHFLQNVHSESYLKDGVAVHVRPLMRILNGMLSYERLVRKSLGWSGYADTLRWLQQMQNGKHHPHFREIVKFWFARDKYAELPIRDILDRAGGLEKVERLFKQPSFPYGKEPISSLERFEVVQVRDELMGLQKTRAIEVIR